MRSFAIAALVGAATAMPADWNYMAQSTACLDLEDGRHLTCALPTHTSYDKAFTMAASLPACSKTSYDCYNDEYCRFCFSHADEYWALEAAMGIKIPKCMEAASTLNCPKKHDVDLWHQSGLLSKVHLFWGHNDLPLPHEDLPVPTCQQLYAGDAAAIAKHC